MGENMLNFNLVKRVSGPSVGKGAESVGGKVNLPVRDTGNEGQSAKSTGGEED
jgi:hypothetical protein